MSTNATAVILGVSTFVRFPDGATENRLALLLPNGVEIETVVSDEGLAAVAGCFGGQTEPVPHHPTPPAVPEHTVETSSAMFEASIVDGAPAFVFGERPYDAVEDVAELVETPPPAAQPSLSMPARKTRVVGRDNAGNPLVEVMGGVSPSEVTGTTGEKDEDGVAQL